jgi:hypothetical protein
MATTPSIPVLAVDTAAWLTARVDTNGKPHYYLASATINQRLNFPRRNLFVTPDWIDDAPIEIALDVYFFFCLDDASNHERIEDYLYACSRCAVNARVERGENRLPTNTPLLIERERIRKPQSQTIQVQLEVNSVFDLASLLCQLGTGDYATIARQLPVGTGDLITVANGDSTNVIELNTLIEKNIFNASIYYWGRDTVTLTGDLFIPTFYSKAKIGCVVG